MSFSIINILCPCFNQGLYMYKKGHRGYVQDKQLTTKKLHILKFGLTMCSIINVAPQPYCYLYEYV